MGCQQQYNQFTINDNRLLDSIDLFNNVPLCLNSHITGNGDVIEAEISHGGFALLLPCIPSSMERKRAIRLQEDWIYGGKKADDRLTENCYFARHLVVTAFGIQLEPSVLDQEEQTRCLLDRIDLDNAVKPEKTEACNTEIGVEDIDHITRSISKTSRLRVLYRISLPAYGRRKPD